MADQQDFITSAREAAYTVVGLGVLGFQRSQVMRRELERRLRDGGVQAGLAGAGAEMRAGLGRLAHEVDHRAEPILVEVDEQVDRIAGSLPGPLGDFLHQARLVATGVRHQLAGLIPPA